MPGDMVLLQQYSLSRDAEAFAELVRRHAGVVYGTSLRITGNSHDAEDVAQECFLELARKAHQVTSSIAGWLHKTAAHRSLDSIRDASTRKRHEEAPMPRRPDAGEPTWHEIAPHVDQALAELSEEVRAPLVLHYLEDRSQEEVADELGVNQSTVSRRIEKGVAELREKLKKAGVVASAALLATLLGQEAAQAAPATLVASLGKMAIAGICESGTAAGAAAGVSAKAGAPLAGALKAKLVAVAAAALLVAGGLVAYRKLLDEEPARTGGTAKVRQAGSDVSGDVAGQGEEATARDGGASNGFEVFSASMSSNWGRGTQFTIDGEGHTTFAASDRTADGLVEFTAEFELRQEDLRQLTRLLEETRWLGAAIPDPVLNRRIEDGMVFDLRLVRPGKTRRVSCIGHHESAGPYRPLTDFLGRLARQERTVHDAGGARGPSDRKRAFRALRSRIRAIRRQDEVAMRLGTPVLDFRRFLPACERSTASPEEYHYEEVVAALDFFGFLRVEDQVERMKALARWGLPGGEPDGPDAPARKVRGADDVRGAAVAALSRFERDDTRSFLLHLAQDREQWKNDELVEALVLIGGKEAAERLREMARVNDDAAWGLIRVGPDAMSSIVEILKEVHTWQPLSGTGRDHDMAQEYLVRMYVEHWDDVPKPLDERIVKAAAEMLRRRGNASFWREYYKRFYRLLAVPGRADVF